MTEWDKFNENIRICRYVGCKDSNLSVCCPELMTRLCNRKLQLLNKLKIKEKDLDKNKITNEEIMSILKI